MDEAFHALGFPKHSKYGFDISSAFIRSSIEDAYPAMPYFDHMACAYATAGDPSSIPEALAGPDAHLWAEALNREASQHEKNGTLGPPINPKDLPPDVKPIPMDVLTKTKRDGTKKARVVIKGFRMSQGIDFNENFAQSRA